MDNKKWNRVEGVSGWQSHLSLVLWAEETAREARGTSGDFLPSPLKKLPRALGGSPTPAWYVGLSAVLTRLLVPSDLGLTPDFTLSVAQIRLYVTAPANVSELAEPAPRPDFMVPPTPGLPGTPGVSCDLHNHQQHRLWISWMLPIGYHAKFNRRAISQ